MYRTAEAPYRAHSSFVISFGLVNIPVGVYTGTEDTQVRRQEFRPVDGQLHEVGRLPYDKDTGDPVDNSVIVRMAYDGATDTWVALRDDEIAACTMPKGAADIITFVPMDELHKAYLTVGLAQIRARTSGLKGAQKVHAERAFSLLLAGLRERNVAALVKVALRGPAKFAAITPDGDLFWLQPTDGIREPARLPDVTFSLDELSLAVALVDTIGISVPPIVDDTAQKVSEYVAKKAQGQPEVLPEQPVDKNAEDLMAAMRRSIEQAQAAYERNKERVS